MLNIFIIIYLDDIFMYTKDFGQAYINAICWILNKLNKPNLFTNLKKCQFYKNKVQFLKYVILA